jgi:hypothetical protein
MRAFVVGVLLCLAVPAHADLPAPDAAVDASGSDGSGDNTKKDDGCSTAGSSGYSALWLAACGAALVFAARRRRRPESKLA